MSRSDNNKSVSDIAELIDVLGKIMRDQKSKPRKIAEMAKMICDQFGIELPDRFVEK